MALDSLTQFSSQHSRKDADARKALVEGSIEQFFKKEDAKVPINAFDVLLAGRVQMKETAAPPTVDHQMAENTPMVNNTPVPLPENTAMAQCIPVPGSIPLPMAQSIPLPEYTPMAQSIPLPENTPIVLSDDDDEDNQKPVEDEELGMSFDFDDIDLDALPDAPSQQKATALPTPVTSLPVKIPVQNTAQVVESIQCKACNRSLMSGFAKDRNIIPNTHPFSFISRYTNTTHLIELCRPGSWIMQDNLVGGPLGANVLPNKYKAEVDRNDRVCYRPLTCQCEASIGAVICDVLDGGNKADMGKVHLWQSAIDVTTRKPVVVRHTRPVESEHEYLPSSQQANMNDMFYNLP
jgi:hypothetical protein